jgi:hypothetical protein
MFAASPRAQPRLRRAQIMSENVPENKDHQPAKRTKATWPPKDIRAARDVYERRLKKLRKQFGGDTGQLTPDEYYELLDGLEKRKKGGAV